VDVSVLKEEHFAMLFDALDSLEVPLAKIIMSDKVGSIYQILL
jgi:hypothetical protein